MSLIKVKSNEYNHRRDSFSDRVCDDLCQHILQYLSTKDKLKLVCVSKQFQRTTLRSNGSLNFSILPKSCEDMDLITQLLQKLPNLTQISVDFSHNFMDKLNDFIELIVKYCDHLRRIRISGGFLIRKEVQKKFIDKFGHKLISTDFHNSFFLTYIEVPNVEELTVLTVYSHISEIVFKRLKRFRVLKLSEKELNQFEVFIETNGKNLKHLDIVSEKNIFTPFTKESLGRLLKIVSKTTNLVHFSFIDTFTLFDKSLTNYLKEIAINCNQLKSLEFRIDFFYNESVSVLKLCKRLKRLYISKNFGYNRTDCFSLLKDLKGLDGLTHLQMKDNCPFDDTFDEKILTDIDINFPKLQSLRILSPIIASEWTAQVLSRLSSLETIWLRIENQEIRPQIERQLIQNCKKFKKFE